MFIEGILAWLQYLGEVGPFKRLKLKKNEQSFSYYLLVPPWLEAKKENLY